MFSLQRFPPFTGISRLWCGLRTEGRKCDIVVLKKVTGTFLARKVVCQGSFPHLSGGYPVCVLPDKLALSTGKGSLEYRLYILCKKG